MQRKRPSPTDGQTTSKGDPMRSTPQQAYNKPPELLAVFDLLVPRAYSLLCATLRAWERSARAEDIGYGRVVLAVRPGGAQELAR
jgi:hypothetical protein